VTVGAHSDATASAKKTRAEAQGHPAPVEDTPKAKKTTVKERKTKKPAQVEETPVEVEETTAKKPAPVKKRKAEENPAKKPAPVEVEETTAKKPAPARKKRASLTTADVQRALETATARPGCEKQLDALKTAFLTVNQTQETLPLVKRGVKLLSVPSKTEFYATLNILKKPESVRVLLDWLMGETWRNSVEDSHDLKDLRERVESHLWNDTDSSAGAAESKSAVPGASTVATLAAAKAVAAAKSAKEHVEASDPTESSKMSLELREASAEKPIHKMTVKDLKEKLGELGLSTDGLKAELVERLEKAPKIMETPPPVEEVEQPDGKKVAVVYIPDKTASQTKDPPKQCVLEYANSQGEPIDVEQVLTLRGNNTEQDKSISQRIHGLCNGVCASVCSLITSAVETPFSGLCKKDPEAAKDDIRQMLRDLNLPYNKEVQFRVFRMLDNSKGNVLQPVDCWNQDMVDRLCKSEMGNVDNELQLQCEKYRRVCKRSREAEDKDPVEKIPAPVEKIPAPAEKIPAPVEKIPAPAKKIPALVKVDETPVDETPVNETPVDETPAYPHLATAFSAACSFAKGAVHSAQAAAPVIASVAKSAVHGAVHGVKAAVPVLERVAKDAVRGRNRPFVVGPIGCAETQRRKSSYHWNGCKVDYTKGSADGDIDPFALFNSFRHMKLDGADPSEYMTTEAIAALDVIPGPIYGDAKANSIRSRSFIASMELRREENRPKRHKSA
jgi:hypothetical protein